MIMITIINTIFFCVSVISRIVERNLIFQHLLHTHIHTRVMNFNLIIKTLLTRVRGLDHTLDETNLNDD